MGLCRTVSEIDGDFIRKSQIFSPRVFCAPVEGVPLELGTGAESQKIRMTELPDRPRSLTISSAVLDTMHQRDRQTDGQTPGDSKDRAYAHSVARQKLKGWRKCLLNRLVVSSKQMGQRRQTTVCHSGTSDTRNVKMAATSRTQVTSSLKCRNWSAQLWQITRCHSVYALVDNDTDVQLVKDVAPHVRDVRP